MFQAAKTNIYIFLLTLVAGLLIALNNLSVLLLVALLLVLWFILERFDSALLLLVFYLPFQVALNLSAGFDVASGRVMILLFFMIWLLRSLKNKKVEIDFSLETLLIGLFLALAAFSLEQAFDMDRALRKILVLYSVFPLYFILTSFAGDRRFLLRLVKSLAAGGFIIAAFGVAQFFAQFYFGINPLFDFFAGVIAPVFYGNTFAAQVVSNPSWLVNVGGATLLRAFALFPDPHIFSFYLGIIIPLVFALLFVEKDDMRHAGLFKSKYVVYVMFATLVLAELFTFSRGGYLGMVASFIVMTILGWRYFTLLHKKIFSALASAGILFVLFGSSSILTRFLSSFDLQEGSNLERMKNWQQGRDTFSDNFFQGVGIGNYSLYLDPTTAYRTPVYAHNLYLGLGAELGVFALLTWLLLILVTIYELYRASRRTHDKVITYLSLGLIGSLVWYSAHSFFDDSLYAPNILAILVTILALAVLVIRYVKMEARKI